MQRDSQLNASTFAILQYLFEGLRRMNHVRVIVVLGLTLVAISAPASPSRLGIYGDRAGTLGSIEIRVSEPMQSTDFYLVAFDHTDGFNAFAYGLEAPELELGSSVFVLRMFSDYGLIDTDGCQNPFQSGCVLGVAGCPLEGPSVMMGYSLLATADAPEDALVCITPFSLSLSDDRGPEHLTCENEIVQFRLEPNPCYDVPAGCLVVNPSAPCGVVRTEPSSWGAVKELF